MKVEFDVTLDDFVDCNNRVIKRSKTLTRFPIKLIVFFAVLIGFEVAFICGFESLWNKVFEGCKQALFFVGLCIIVFFVTLPIRNRRLRRHFREQYGTDGPVKNEVEITKSGILVKQHGTQTSFGWEIVKSIEERGDAIEFWKSGGLVIVRDRAFDSKEQRSEFLDLCKRYLDRAQTSKVPVEK